MVLASEVTCMKVRGQRQAVRVPGPAIGGKFANWRRLFRDMNMYLRRASVRNQPEQLTSLTLLLAPSTTHSEMGGRVRAAHGNPELEGRGDTRGQSRMLQPSKVGQGLGQTLVAVEDDRGRNVQSGQEQAEVKLQEHHECIQAQADSVLRHLLRCFY